MTETVAQRPPMRWPALLYARIASRQRHPTLSFSLLAARKALTLFPSGGEEGSYLIPLRRRGRHLSLHPVLMRTKVGILPLRPERVCTGLRNMSHCPVPMCTGAGNLSLCPMLVCAGASLHRLPPLPPPFLYVEGGAGVGVKVGRQQCTEGKVMGGAMARAMVGTCRGLRSGSERGRAGGAA